MERDPNRLVTLTTALTEFEAGVIVATLEGEGIDARHFATVGTMLGCHAPALHDPIKILVRAADAHRAALVLSSVRADSVDLDWSEVNVGARIEPAPTEIDPTRLQRTLKAMFCLVIGAFVVGLAVKWLAGQP